MRTEAHASLGGSLQALDLVAGPTSVKGVAQDSPCCTHLLVQNSRDGSNVRVSYSLAKLANVKLTLIWRSATLASE